MFCFRLNYEGAIIAKKAASDVTEATGLQKFVAGAIGRKHAKRRNLQIGISCAISRNFCYKNNDLINLLLLRLVKQNFCVLHPSVVTSGTRIEYVTPL